MTTTLLARLLCLPHTLLLHILVILLHAYTRLLPITIFFILFLKYNMRLLHHVMPRFKNILALFYSYILGNYFRETILFYSLILIYFIYCYNHIFPNIFTKNKFLITQTSIYKCQYYFLIEM